SGPDGPRRIPETLADRRDGGGPGRRRRRRDDGVSRRVGSAPRRPRRVPAVRACRPGSDPSGRPARPAGDEAVARRPRLGVENGRNYLRRVFRGGRRTLGTPPTGDEDRLKRAVPRLGIIAVVLSVMALATWSVKTPDRTTVVIPKVTKLIAYFPSTAGWSAMWDKWN